MVSEVHNMGPRQLARFTLEQIEDSMRRLLDAEAHMTPTARERMIRMATREQLALRMMRAKEACDGR